MASQSQYQKITTGAKLPNKPNKPNSPPNRTANKPKSKSSNK